METDWKKKWARDFLALGSWVFFILVLARALIKPYRPLVDQVFIAGVVLVIAVFILKHDGYIARGLTVAFFTILFYQDTLFNVFALIAVVGLIVSSHFVGSNWKNILLGLVVGAVASGVGWYLSGFTLGWV